MSNKTITFGTLVRNIEANKAGYVVEVGRGYAIVKYADGTASVVNKKNLEVTINQGNPMPNPALRRVTITYEVLAPLDANVENYSLDQIHGACRDGDCSGRFISTKSTLLTKAQSIKACADHGTDPEFFGIDA